jgi:hypothetical protein
MYLEIESPASTSSHGSILRIRPMRRDYLEPTDGSFKVITDSQACEVKWKSIPRNTSRFKLGHDQAKAVFQGVRLSILETQSRPMSLWGLGK